MTTPEHLLAIVEPSPGGDGALDVAHDVVERGGSVSLLLMITDRVRQDIADFARGADLSLGEAEAIAIDQMSDACERRVGSATTTTIVHASSSDRDVRRYLTPDTTAIAIPADLAGKRNVERLSAATGLPVVVAPHRPHRAA